jgi:hypothetical protein
MGVDTLSEYRDLFLSISNSEYFCSVIMEPIKRCLRSVCRCWHTRLFQVPAFWLCFRLPNMVFSYRHQPMKTLYILVGAIWLLVRMPYWMLHNLMPAWRPRRSWSLRCFTVAVMDNAVAILLETALPANDSLENMAKTGQKMGFVWLDPIPSNLIVGDIQKFGEMNDVKPECIGGFWYGPRAADDTFGQVASPGEKVFYLIHGE